VKHRHTTPVKYGTTGERYWMKAFLARNRRYVASLEIVLDGVRIG